MFKILDRVNWQVAGDALMRGDPPLIVQLLALNSIVFILFVIQRIRRKGPSKPSGAHMAQALFIVANVLILSQQQLKPFYEQRVIGMWNSVDRMLSK
jgi:alanine-alpha-ketoisovalerate/valine-pyruvate aminotransferase